MSEIQYSEGNQCIIIVSELIHCLPLFTVGQCVFLCLSVFVQVPATDRNALSSLWGKLASEILMQNWEAAMEDLTRLRETIDNNVMPHHSEFNTALRFPYIGLNIDRLAFEYSTAAVAVPPLLSSISSIPSHRNSQVKQNLNCCVMSVQLDF